LLPPEYGTVMVAVYTAPAVAAVAAAAAQFIPATVGGLGAGVESSDFLQDKNNSGKKKAEI
jgi:hypothetical protein